MIRAVEKADGEKDLNFQHTTWWIRQAITKPIADKSRTVDSVHLHDTMAAVRAAQAQLKAELEEIKPQEIAKWVELKVELALRLPYRITRTASWKMEN